MRSPHSNPISASDTARSRAALDAADDSDGGCGMALTWRSERIPRILKDMRVRDVRIGETYVVAVPQRLPSGRYPLRTDDVAAVAEWQQLHRLRGSRFRLTVTALDTAATPPMVEGIRITPGSHVRLNLTPDQVQELGLPAGDYAVDGLLRDASDGLVELPDLSPLRIPARWMRT